jgi:hypothetical protein
MLLGEEKLSRPGLRGPGGRGPPGYSVTFPPVPPWRAKGAYQYMVLY